MTGTTTGLDPTQHAGAAPGSPTAQPGRSTESAGGDAGTPTPKAGAGNAFALWIATLLLKFLQVPDPPDTFKQAIAKILTRFGWLLAFGALVPPLCAFFLGLMDKMGANGLADHYRDYVVSGFRINESIYRADKERIDYLLQMRRVNFYEGEENDGDINKHAVSFTIIPNQEGRIVIEQIGRAHV